MKEIKKKHRRRKKGKIKKETMKMEANLGLETQCSINHTYFNALHNRKKIHKANKLSCDIPSLEPCRKIIEIQA